MRSAANFGASVFNIVSSCVSTLVLLPLIQGAMGVEAYGYVGVAASFINMSTIFSVAITSMAARFISLAINKRDYNEANAYFNSVLFACMILGLCFLTIFSIVSWNIASVMNVSSAMVPQVQSLLMVMAGSLFCTMLKTPFTASFYASNRLYIDCLFLGFSQLARILAPLALFGVIGPSIWLPYAGALCVDVSACVFYFLRYRRYYPDLAISISSSQFALVREMLSSGIWVSIQKAGSVLLSTISLYLANLMIGEYATGIFNTITQLQNFMSVYATAIVNLYIPYIYWAYAEEDKPIASVLQRGFQFVGLMLGSVFGGVVAFATTFLTLWAGLDMSPYRTCIIIMVTYPILTYSCELLNQIFIAEKAVRVPALATILFGVLNIALSAVFCLGFKCGAVGLAAAQAISLLLRNYLVIIPYASHRLDIQIHTLIRQSLFAAIVSLFSLIFGALFSVVLEPKTIALLLVDGLLSVLIGLGFGFVALPHASKEFVLTKIRLRN